MKEEVERTGKEGQIQVDWFGRYGSGISFWWVPLPSVQCACPVYLVYLWCNDMAA